MKFLAYLIYIPLQIAWLPLSLIGSLWLWYKQILISKRMGLSQTAIEIFNGRWTLDWFGIRSDAAARRLAHHLPNTSVSGLRLALFPLWVACKIAGQPILYPVRPDPEKARLVDLVASRTPIFDQFIKEGAADANQFIVLGAGLDTRCYGPMQNSHLKFFELDRAVMQTNKREQLEAAGIDASHVRFTAADFNDPNWMDALDNAGFDQDVPSVFLWEGVTLYLSEADIFATLEMVKQRARAGSRIVLDIYSTGFIAMGQRGGAARMLELTGEQFKFGLEFGPDPKRALQDFAEQSGLTLQAFELLGAASKTGPFMAVAVLLV